MADYNIYIHSLGGESQNYPTVPWDQESDEQHTPWKQGNNNGESQEVNEMAEITGAISKIGKIGIGVLTAKVVVNTAKQIWKGVVDYQAVVGGDFRGSIAYSNYEAIKSDILHPISTTYNLFKTMVANQVQTQRSQLQRELLGDSHLSSFMNRGY